MINRLFVLILLSSNGVTAFVGPLTTATRTSHAVPSMPSSSQRFMATDEDVDKLVQQEIETQAKMSKFTNEKGMQYAPWLGVSDKDEAKIRQLVKEKAQARLKRMEQERETKGVLSSDSQAQELSGVGLKSRIVDGNCVELEWATSSEKYTEGFLVKRRPVKTKDFQVIASYKTFGPLASQGRDGGVYRFLDDSGLEPGGYFYRITECEVGGDVENDLSQCLVELQTAEEQRGAVLAAVGVVAVLVAAVVAGALLDPVQS
ncbi:hypothetical protein ACA910_013873 [Epithemia clementina (nom. ined.)]